MLALISAAACGSSPSTGPDNTSTGTGGIGGSGGTGGQVDTAGVGNGTTTAATGFVDKTLFEGGATYKYKVFVPESYNSAATVPVILTLHSAGERGSDNLVQTRRASAASFAQRPRLFPRSSSFRRVPWEKGATPGRPSSASPSSLSS